MKYKRKQTELFSVSFLDCICCGFGAVLLLFVLTANKKGSIHDQLESQIQEIIGQRDNDIAMKDNELMELRLSLNIERKKSAALYQDINDKKKMRTKLEEELMLLLQQLSSLEESLEKLISDKENIPTVEEKPPIPIPNTLRRQYLTGFKMHGDRVLFLVEMSGGMLDDNAVAAAGRLADSEEEKRNAPKWRRVKNGLRWLIANLKKESSYKIVFFNNDIHELETETGADWLDPANDRQVLEVLEQIEDFFPEEGANLERAFSMVGSFSSEPDRIILIVDGLPTLSDSYTQGGSESTDQDRINMFRAAKRALSITVPVNTILYPMQNDPGAAVHYWRLSDEMGGAMVCPSESWPNI